MDLAEALLQRETLDAEQVKRLSAGLPLDDPAPAPQTTPPRLAQPAKERPAPSILPPLPPKPLTQE
jgi:cell division protease FtsH